MKLGTTFSHRHAAWLGLSPIKALEEVINLNFDLIRLCCYWNEIEKQPGDYDFSTIIHLLNHCEEKKQPVIVTIGMKSPRWPEFYIPTWLSFHPYPPNIPSSLFTFLTQTLKELTSYSCITHWQVENEPLDPSGPKNQTVPLDILEQEVALIKLNDSRPIVITLWGNELKKRNLLLHVTNLADIIGIDLYYKQFITKKFGFSFYSSPSPFMGEGWGEGEVWITELQAEPWEADEAGYKSENPKSMSPELLLRNFERAKQLNPKAILFWGSEYWLWKKTQGDTRIIETVQSIIKLNNTKEPSSKQ